MSQLMTIFQTSRPSWYKMFGFLLSSLEKNYLTNNYNNKNKNKGNILTILRTFYKIRTLAWTIHNIMSAAQKSDFVKMCSCQYWIISNKHKAKRILTNTLHGFIYGAQVWRAADITSSTVWIQALLTFCAKIAIKTCFTIFNFTFWKTQEKQRQS